MGRAKRVRRARAKKRSARRAEALARVLGRYLKGRTSPVLEMQRAMETRAPVWGFYKGRLRRFL